MAGWTRILVPTLFVAMACGRPAASSDETTSAATSAGDAAGSTETGPSSTCEWASPGSECGMWCQDCPEGEQCVPSGSAAWPTTECAPIGEVSFGPPCGPPGEGPNCVPGFACWEYDPDTGQGQCHSMCAGDDPFSTACPTGHRCFQDDSYGWALCLQECDPFNPFVCDDTESCVPQQPNCGPLCFPLGSTGGFFCKPDGDGSGKPLGAPCDYSNGGCASGSMCIDADLLDGCGGENGCCTSLCQLNNDTCEGGLVCTPVFEPGTASTVDLNIGVCVVP